MYKAIEQGRHLAAACIPACTHIDIEVDLLEPLESRPTPTPVTALHADLQDVRSTVQRPPPTPISAMLGRNLLDLAKSVFELSSAIPLKRVKSGHLTEN